MVARCVTRGVVVAGMLLVLGSATRADDYPYSSITPGSPWGSGGPAGSNQLPSSLVPLPPPASATNNFVYQSSPTDPTAPPAHRVEVAQELAQKICESSWYVRADYYYWDEHDPVLGDLDTETGVLTTVGYQHRSGAERFRLEFFGGSVNYSGNNQYPNPDGSVTLVPMSATTNLIGTRLEYELLFDPDLLPSLSFFVGAGTRFWVRSLRDSTDSQGTYSEGYDETWWTFYPYIGLETRRRPNVDFEWYFSSRIGFTAFTYQYVDSNQYNYSEGWVQYPQAGLTGSIELGLRGRNLNAAVYFEGMRWEASPEYRGTLQPQSTMLLLGVRGGLTF